MRYSSGECGLVTAFTRLFSSRSLPQLAGEEIEPKLSFAASEPDLRRVQLAFARRSRVPAAAVRLAALSMDQIAPTPHRRTMVYDMSDPAQRNAIEEVVRSAVAEAGEAHAQARVSVHFAKVLTAVGDGTWTAMRLQVEEQGD